MLYLPSGVSRESSLNVEISVPFIYSQIVKTEYQAFIQILRHEAFQEK
jgi:hypothetical protein